MEMILRIYPYHYFAVYKSIFISSCTVVFSFFKFSACPTSAKFQWLCPNHFQHTCALLLCQDSSLQSQGPVKAPGEGTSLGEVNLEGYRVTQIQENHIKDHQRPSFPGPNVWMSTCNKLKTTDSKKKWWLKECWRHPWSKQHQDHKPDKPAFLRPLADVLWPGVARRSEPDFKAVRNRGHGSLGISSLTVQAHACWPQQTSKEVKSLRSLAIPACTWFLRDFGKMNVVAILPSRATPYNLCVVSPQCLGCGGIASWTSIYFIGYCSFTAFRLAHLIMADEGPFWRLCIFKSYRWRQGLTTRYW